MVPKRILVIDAERHTHRRVASICSRRRYSCIHATSVAIARDVLRSVRTDLVIVDADTVSVDEFLTSLEGVEVPPIVCTTRDRDILQTLPKERVKLLMVKPLEEPLLRRAIDQLTGTRSPGALAAAPAVLLVEDRAGMRFLLRNALRGIVIDEAATMFDARLRLRSSRIDLLIVDRQLPEESGDPLLHELCSEARLLGAAVVIVTSAVTTAQEREQLCRMADSVIGPDFLGDQALRTSVSTLLRLRGFAVPLLD